MASAEHVYGKYRRADDEAGDAAWAGKQSNKAICLSPGIVGADLSARLQLDKDEQVLVHLLRLPRRFGDVEGSGVMDPVQVRRFLRALHAAEVLKLGEINEAKALIPLEVKRARATLDGKKVEPTRRRSKLRGRVYRPSIDGARESQAQAASPSPQVQKVEPGPKASDETGASSEADLALERELNQVVKQHKTADHFAVLGVSRDAVSDEIKEAYFNLAKRFHPDRVAGYTFKNPQAVEAKIEKVFARINEAYHALQDPEARREYVEQLEAGITSGIKTGGKVRRPQEADLQHRKGMVFLHKKDFANAQRMFQLAAEFDNENPIYPAHWAWARYYDERLDKGAREKEARERLEEIMAKTPLADAAYFLGTIYKLANRDNAAYQSFKKCIELAPKHTEAQREVRLYELRKDRAKQASASAQKPANILERFLKK